MLCIRTEAVRLHQGGPADVDGLCPFDFQAALEEYLMDETTRAVFLSAETGAGKTRAFTLPALKRHKNLIIVAPTNALIQDIRANVQRLCDQVGAPHTVHAITRYALYALKGQLPPNRRPTQGQVLLELLRDEVGSPGRPRVLVTNPDSLAVALQALYYNSESILREVIYRYPWVVFDEFHAYAPKQIPCILFLHALSDAFAGSAGRKTVCSSATPSFRFRDVLQRVLGIPDAALVELDAQTQAEGFQVLQPTRFTFAPRESGWDRSALRRYVAEHVSAIQGHLRTGSSSDGARRVCIIANSVFEASEIADLLAQAGFSRDRDIEEIRGFLAPGQRGRGKKPIVVGTSAIELGVNFPISLLYTEGAEGAALIQRLGRLGRSDLDAEAEAHVLVPQAVYDQLCEIDGRTVPRFEFREKVLSAYPTFESFWSYVEQLGLYENWFYIQRMEELNTRYRARAAPHTSPRQRAFLEETLLPRLARGYGVVDWKAHLKRVDEYIDRKGRRARDAVERVLSSPRGETAPVTCAIFDRADARRGLFPHKVYDARLLLTRGDVLQYGPWEWFVEKGERRRRPPRWYTRAARQYAKLYPALWEEHRQELETGDVQMFVDLNGLTEEYRKLEYETSARFSGLRQGELYALELRYWFELLGLMEQADFSEALAGRATLVASLQYGRYQGALKHARNLPPLFDITTLHLGSGAFQVALGVNALYVWSQSLAEASREDTSRTASAEDD
ncbi:MAG TPA: type I-D CRISPR-associated helicase Cas3' [Anaerolineae bacterium]|nr:type I-D CRISPR-associated helicase Cas3' [Anaerolineae bacterium]HPL28803.1 type I-D CRISPR-associated helicase Cas3' [Anaerolineae bacterium]